jgi:uncharacterized protein YkwD
MNAWSGRPEGSPTIQEAFQMRGGLARFAAATTLAVTLLVTAATAAPPASAQLRREKMLGWVNHARTEHGVRKLKMDRHCVAIAHDHNVDMATKDQLFHSTNLSYKLRYVNWSTWGENVGVGPDAYSLFKAYMASPDHRANILSRNYDHVGISFIYRDGALWSTMIFYG